MTTHIVLIIDDPHEVILITGALRPMGHEIIRKTSNHSLDDLADIEPNLLIIHIGHTFERDLTLIQAIRLDSRFDDVPVLATSTLDMEDVRHQCMALGCQHFITQPMPPHNFRQIVQSYLP